MADGPDGEVIEREVGAAIADVLARHENGFTTKWIVLAESVGPDGSTGLWTMTSEHLKTWDAKGMLTHALDAEKAKTIRDELSS